MTDETAGDLLSQIVQALGGDVEVQVKVYGKGMVYGVGHYIHEHDAHQPFVSERVLGDLLQKLLAEVKKARGVG